MGEYDDIIRLPHHRSAVRPHMSMRDRAAQFSPFAALTGYGEAVEETARRTEARRELDEQEKALLSRQLETLQSRLREAPEAAIRCYVSDGRKSGGAYETFSGPVAAIDPLRRCLTMQDGTKIRIEHIVQIDLMIRPHP